MTWEENGIAQMWVNGTKQAATSTITTVGAWGYLQMGASLHTGSLTSGLSGSIDDVGIWAGVKSDTFIGDLNLDSIATHR